MVLGKLSNVFCAVGDVLYEVLDGVCVGRCAFGDAKCRVLCAWECKVSGPTKELDRAASRSWPASMQSPPRFSHRFPRVLALALALLLPCDGAALFAGEASMYVGEMPLHREVTAALLMLLQ